MSINNLAVRYAAILALCIALKTKVGNKLYEDTRAGVPTEDKDALKLMRVLNLKGDISRGMQTGDDVPVDPELEGDGAMVVEAPATLKGMVMLNLPKGAKIVDVQDGADGVVVTLSGAGDIGMPQGIDLKVKPIDFAKVGKGQYLTGPDGVDYTVEGVYADHLTVRTPGSQELLEVTRADLVKFAPALMPLQTDRPAPVLTKAQQKAAAKTGKGKGEPDPAPVDAEA